MRLEKNMVPKKYTAYTNKNYHKIQHLKNLPSDVVTQVKAVSKVLPFKANNYVVDELIDWDMAPEDPLFRLVFPLKEMIAQSEYLTLKRLVLNNAPESRIKAMVADIHRRMNPHPAGQKELNVPEEGGSKLNGIQHKYDETVLFFPFQGQTCHAYCTYCFRWAQFVGADNFRFASKDVETVIRYLENHPEVTDVLITGGDPLIMSAKLLRKYIEPLIRKAPGNVNTIRIGTKAPAYWPYRFLTDTDTGDLIRLFSEIVASGFHLALMAHYTHYRELETVAARTAVDRIKNTGAVIRSQSPVIKHVNDSPEVWAKMWQMQGDLGIVPYYMFVERDTGPRSYFSLPLKEAYEIFTGAYKNVSGLERTVRGPVMSAAPGKVLVDGIAEIDGHRYFVLKFIQARNPDWVNRVFFAEYDENARWLDELVPAFGGKEFFFSYPNAA